MKSKSWDFIRHTTATHMLEAGIPIMAIKNFLGHVSLATTQRYTELSQDTVNRHVREWNEKWFSHQTPVSQKQPSENRMPDFLM
jgi:integrase/recombinase XerD